MIKGKKCSSIPENQINLNKIEKVYFELKLIYFGVFVELATETIRKVKSINFINFISLLYKHKILPKWAEKCKRTRSTISATLT